VAKSSKDPTSAIPFKIVEIDPQTASEPAAADTLGLLQLSAMSSAPAPVRSDQVRPGDTLTITIYEVGVALFGQQTAMGVDPSRAPTASGQTVHVQVREDGSIDFPCRAIDRGGHLSGSPGPADQDAHAPTLRKPRCQRGDHRSLENTAYISGAVKNWAAIA
jgi:polysaccharide export outer membrane protein